MSKFKTKVITDESQVPNGFKRICELTSSLTEQKKLSDAHTDGTIEAVKLMRSVDDKTGPVWVDAKAADRILWMEKPVAVKAGHSESIDSRHAESVCKSLAGMEERLDEIYVILERLAVAAESIATQPKASDAEGSWRGVNGECV